MLDVFLSLDFEDAGERKTCFISRLKKTLSESKMGAFLRPRLNPKLSDFLRLFLDKGESIADPSCSLARVVAATQPPPRFAPATEAQGGWTK